MAKTNKIKTRSNEMKVTQKEMEFLNQIADSDFSWDDTVNDYITDYEYNMKSVRGLIPSLVEKGIIQYEEHCGVEDEKGRNMAWACVNDKFLDWENCKFKNIEVA